MTEVVRGKNTKIHPGAIIYGEVEYGDNCKFQAGCILVPGVICEDNVFIGPGVITTNDPQLDGKLVQTYFKKGCKIGAGAMIKGGVTIGAYAVVGMGAVVLEDVSQGVTVVGNPARPIKANPAYAYYE